MKTGRNAPCPCGSGKKHKKCCIDAAPHGSGSMPQTQRPRLLDEETPIRDTEGSGGAVEAIDRAWEPTREGPLPQTFWDDYEMASLDDRIAMARTVIVNTKDLDDEDAYYVLEQLVGPLQEAAQLNVLAGARPYRAAAFAQAISCFLHILQEHELLTAGEVRRIKAVLNRRWTGELPKALDAFTCDPRMLQDVRSNLDAMTQAESELVSTPAVGCC